MLPLIPFAAGILTGVVAIKLARNEKAKKHLENAQERMQNATVSGLSAIEQSSAPLRNRLQAPVDAEVAAEEAAVAPVAVPKAAGESDVPA